MKNIFLICLMVVTAVNSQSPCDQVPFVDRAGWGAQEPTEITNLTGKPLSFYVVHHTYEPASCYDDATCSQRVKDIQYFHQHDQNWSDIGYHFLVGENGKVYEGRGWDRQGAHSPGWNTAAYGICIIGNFTVASPNEKALNVLRLWMDCGIERGNVKQDDYIITHRQSQQPRYTECPGDGTFNQVDKWPRFCSYQNSGGNLTQNETRPSEAQIFCEKEIGSTSSSTTSPGTTSPGMTSSGTTSSNTTSSGTTSSNTTSSGPPSLITPAIFLYFFLIYILLK